MGVVQDEYAFWQLVLRRQAQVHCHQNEPQQTALPISESHPGGWAEGNGNLLDDGQVAWSRGRYLVVPGGQQTPVVSIVSWESHQ